MSLLGRKDFVRTLGAGGAAALLAGCETPQSDGTATAASAAPATVGLDGDLKAIAQARGLTEADVIAALKTFVPLGQHDDYVMFASGGHSGQVVVMGVPSMRILKVIPVFTPDAYTGWGFSSASKSCLTQGSCEGTYTIHGDTHHPALSETNGDYDGRWCFINDKVNARVAVIDLHSFQTVQIVKNPLAIDDHGHCVTPNTEYVIETTQYGAPLAGEYVDLTPDNYIEHYRGVATYWKFDKSKGRIDPSKSFAIELPPYNQDLTDAGKLVSDGWSFTNSFNSELTYGQDYSKGGMPAEAGMSQNAADFMHVINWKKAERLVASGSVRKRSGMYFISIGDAVRNGLLFLLPEPKSPHGVDVTPDGRFIAVGGKLDPHVQIYSFAKILAATKRADLKKDRYGIPILPIEHTRIAQVPIGLGPLHTQFDGHGNGYTSLYLDSAVAKWSIGDENGKGWEMVDKLPLQYNTGHLAAPHGDTVKPRGEYVVGLNKWSIDRFTPVGPRYPRNLQLVDVTSEKMAHLYDGPIGMAEPHYAQIIDASLLKPLTAFPIGYDPGIDAVNPDAPKVGREGVHDMGDRVLVSMTELRSHFTPDVVKVKKGQRITWRITNVEGAVNTMHGFALGGYNMSLTLEPGKMEEFEFVADREGVFPFYCTDFCSALHLEMMGYLLVS
ncbi:MAG: Sec-dependent nitrous-oxide reductase [Vulcanimicrobiaceae bacterium]